MTAAEQLSLALLDLADRGRRPRCAEPGGHELWCSDDVNDRAQAARWCTGCPVLTECAAAADEHDERFGVFGGVDRTPPPAKRKSESGVGVKPSRAGASPVHLAGSETSLRSERDPLFQPHDPYRSH